MAEQLPVALYFFSAVIAITIIGICWRVWQCRRRANQMAEVAWKLGFAFQADGRKLLEQELSRVPLFAMVPVIAGNISSVFRGSVEATNVVVFDYSYRTGGTASRQNEYAQTVACFPIPGLPAFTLHREAEMPPHLALTTAKMLANIGERFPGSDARWELFRDALSQMEEPGIQFETHPAFNRMYRLQGADREAIQALFQSATLHFFEQETRPTLLVESAADWLVVYCSNRLVRPLAIASFLVLTSSIARRFSE